MLLCLVLSSFVRNTASLYAVQLAEYVLPILTVPYLSRTLQPDEWGAVLYTQGFGAWLGLLFEYGFNMSATRSIAQNQRSPDRHAEIASGVLGGTGLLLGIGAVIAAGCAWYLPMFHGRLDWLLLGAGLAFVQGVRPWWYFQGIEELHWVALLNFASRVVVTAGIFVLVRSMADGWIVLALQLGAGTGVLAVACWRMYRAIPFVPPTWRRSVDMLRESWSLFVLRSSISLYTLANTVVLGVFAPAREVTFFGGPERLNKAATGLLQPISQALYPRMNRLLADDPGAAVRVTWLSLLVLGGLGAAGGLGMAILAPWLVPLFLGPGYEPAVDVFRILAWLMPCVAISNVLGVQWMIPRRMDSHVNRVMIAAGVLDLVLACWLAPRYGARGMAWAVVAAEAWVVLGLVLTLEWNGQTFWRVERKK